MPLIAMLGRDCPPSGSRRPGLAVRGDRRPARGAGHEYRPSKADPSGSEFLSKPVRRAVRCVRLVIAIPMRSSKAIAKGTPRVRAALRVGLLKKPSETTRALHGQIAGATV